MSYLSDKEKSYIKNCHWPFFGCFMQQNPLAVLSMNRLLNEYDFSTIIELGTHDGGFSTLFAIYCAGSSMPAHAENPNEPSLYKNLTHHKKRKRFFTFDNVLRDIPRLFLLIQMGAHFEKVDFLHDSAVIEKISNIIRFDGRTLLLCDGGNKKLESELFMPFLKRDDIVMVHDWAYDEKMLEYNKSSGIWDGWESCWKKPSEKYGDIDIGDICVKNRVRQIHSDEFDGCVWFCGIKE